LLTELLTIDPHAREAEALLEHASPPSDRLTIDGVEARIVHTSCGRRLCVPTEDNCRWGPAIEYLETVISVVLLNGRIFRRTLYESLIAEGRLSEYEFGCWPVENIDETPGARAVVEAWEAHHRRVFEDVLIVMWPSWGGQPAPAFVPLATLRKFVRLAVWLYFDSPPAPWLFRRDPLSGQTKLVPNDPEVRHLEPAEAALRAGQTLDHDRLESLGLRDTTLWQRKLASLEEHDCDYLAAEYWRFLAQLEPSPVAARAPFYFRWTAEDAVIDEALANAEAKPRESYLDRCGLGLPVLVPEKRAWLAARGHATLARLFEAMLVLDADLRALGLPGAGPYSVVRWDWVARSNLPEREDARRRLLAAAIAAFEHVPAPAFMGSPSERAFEFEFEGRPWRGYFGKFHDTDANHEPFWKLKLTRCKPA
jgi:hypothetical protein